MRHQTRRQGRPYTLVLTKTDELFTRATNARNKAVTDLSWLTSHGLTHRHERKVCNSAAASGWRGLGEPAGHGVAVWVSLGIGH